MMMKHVMMETVLTVIDAHEVVQLNYVVMDIEIKMVQIISHETLMMKSVTSE